MTNPLNEALTIVWGPKSYQCDITLGQLALIEGELDVAIVYPAPLMLWQKPEAYQRSVLLYALMKPHGFTLAQCAEAIAGERRDYFLAKLTKVTERLMPQLKSAWGAKEDQQQAPLAESSGGLNSGPTPESICE